MNKFVLCLALCVAVASATKLSLTGDAWEDFYPYLNTAADQTPGNCDLYSNDNSVGNDCGFIFFDPHNAITVEDNRASNFAGESEDVGVPTGVTTRSGWDMRAVFLNYHRAGTEESGVCTYHEDDSINTCGDIMQLGIDCYGICGDADGDGDQGSAGSVVTGNGGFDLSNLDDTETFAFLIDIDADTLWTNDNAFSPTLAVGWPTTADTTITTFGIYNFDPRFILAPPAGFLDEVVSFAFDYHEIFPSTFNPDAVDVEFEVHPWSQLFEYVNPTDPPLDAVYDDIKIKFNVFAGSFQDDGVGEDFIPDSGRGVPVTWPGCDPDVCNLCPEDYGYGWGVDECGYCPGHSFYGLGEDSCGYCPEYFNYNNARDECGQCDGPGVDDCGLCYYEAEYMTHWCWGCDDIPFSGLEWDECGVCDGDGSTCCEPDEYKGYWMWEIDQMITYYGLVECHEALCYTIGQLEESMDLTYEYWWVWSWTDTEPLPFCDYLDILWWFNDCLDDFSVGLTTLSMYL